VGTVVSPDPAGVDVRTGVPDGAPGVDPGGDVLLNVHPADTRVPQRTKMITSMTLNCIVKNASLSYIMLVPEPDHLHPDWYGEISVFCFITFIILTAGPETGLMVLFMGNTAGPGLSEKNPVPPIIPVIIVRNLDT